MRTGPGSIADLLSGIGGHARNAATTFHADAETACGMGGGIKQRCSERFCRAACRMAGGACWGAGAAALSAVSSDFALITRVLHRHVPRGLSSVIPTIESTHFFTLLQTPIQIDQLKRPAAPIARSTRLAAWWLPVLILLGFALLFALLFRDRLIPAREVRVVVAMAIADDAVTAGPSAKPDNADDRLLFQASGWLEPDPLPVRATALTDGVVAEVHVLEGQLVDAGEPLATLIDDDARLARDMIASELAMKQAEFDAHCVEVQTSLQKLAAEQAGLAQAHAAVEEASDRFERLTRGPAAATTESERVAARLEKLRREAAVEIFEARIREISWDFNRIAYETLAHQHGIEATRTKLAETELNLQRTRLTAPVSGRVMRLLATPGEKKMLGMDEMESATVAIIYDPVKLQVRVDVPLADAANLAVGQRTRVRCSLLPNAVFEGEVTRIAGEADIARNTLQAKVRVIDPDDRLRPEMICRVEFLEMTARADVVRGAPAAGDLAVFIPQSALVGDAQIWICDPETSRVESREVIATNDTRDGWLRLESGARPGEWVVDDPATSTLNPGQRVRPIFTP